jgi:hypothetical protein
MPWAVCVPFQWYTSWPKVCGRMLIETSHSKIMGNNIYFVPPFAAISTSTCLGRLSTICWNIATGTCFHSATRALVRLGTDVGRLDLARCLRSNSSQSFWMGLRSGLCAGQSSSSTPISANYLCMDLTSCTGALSCWNRKGPSPS